MFFLGVILALLSILPMFLYKKEINNNPLPPFYKKGVYHMHSVYSDGKGTLDEITAAARPLGIDFTILTDHGNPNRKASSATSFSNEVLLIGGSEFSLHCGHLAVVGAGVPRYRFPPEPQEAIDEVNARGGACYISHPFDDKIPWTRWDSKGFSGLEILSCYSSARKISLLKLMAFPLRYLLNSNYALTGTLRYPTENVNRWDRLNVSEPHRRYFGIYALDAHAQLPISDSIRLNFPTYASMFDILTVYVRLAPGNGVAVQKQWNLDAHKSAAAVISALRSGCFFNVVEAIAPANGFDAFVNLPSGKRIHMGGASSVSQGLLDLLLPFDFETEVQVLKNGKQYHRVTSNRTRELEVPLDGAGCYRVEVFVPGNFFDSLPWIMTNPFFLGQEETPPTQRVPQLETELAIKIPLEKEEGFFQVEKNRDTTASLSRSLEETGESVQRLQFHLRPNPSGKGDFWAALAARRNLEFRGLKGISFEARGDKKRRFWVEFRTGTLKRTGEQWFRHSFLAGKRWRRVMVPFEDFYRIFSRRGGTAVLHPVPFSESGEAEELLSEVHALFFSINNANAYAGSKGFLEIKNIGVY